MFAKRRDDADNAGRTRHNRHAVARRKPRHLYFGNPIYTYSLPNGVFAPYTSIPTNILFFDRSGPTREVWYYEQPLPEGRKNYTKTAPIQFEEFAPLIAWWDQPGPGTKREENDRAWKVPAAELLANGCNLDRKNPRAKEDITHLPPEQLAESILAKERRIAEILGDVKSLLTRTK